MKMTKTQKISFSNAVIGATLVALTLANLAGAETVLNGAGASFPYPIYSKWFSEYRSVNPNVQINYQSIGSGGGIKQVTARTVDFGATDGPMSSKQLFAVDGKLLHIPMVLGGVVAVFNLPGITELKLTGGILADIFLGKITAWNDPAIKAANPGVNLPSTAITVVHRSDGSGTTFCFTDFLSKVSKAWKQKVGNATAVNWPAGLGAKGNEGVTGLVKQTVGSIGYTELTYATQNGLSCASIQNKAGNYVKADVETVSAAAAGVDMPKDFRVSIVNASGENAYPISTFTWILVYESNTGGKGKILRDVLKWALTEGQPMAKELGYSPVPESVKAKVLKAVEKIG
jgi:phosphate transport system substrate-binding protein